MMIPVVRGIILGDIEHYGLPDSKGRWVPVDDPSKDGPLKRVSYLNEEMGLLMPCSAEILDSQGVPLAVAHFDAVDGRIGCVALLALDGRDLSAHHLRQVPLAKLGREAARANLVHLRNKFAVHFIDSRQNPPLEAPVRKRVLSDDFLKRVADIYRRAVLAGVSTQEEIQRQLGPCDGQTARRWVVKARRAGFLGPSRGPWQAGEVYEDGISS